MNTAIKNKALAYRRVLLEHVLFFYHLHQQAVFWGLRMMLAFLLLLLSLSPTVSGFTQTICLLTLGILGIICLLDNARQIHAGQTTRSFRIKAKATNKTITQARVNRRRKGGQRVAEPLDLRQLVFEVNAFAEQKNLTRKTIELSVWPDAYGKRHATKAIDQLKSAGYAIRLYTDGDLPDDLVKHDQNMIGERNGYVHVYLIQ